MLVEHYIQENIAILYINCDLTKETVPAVKTETQKLFLNGYAVGLVINLNSMKHIDSDGLGFFFSLVEQFKLEGKQSIFCQFNWEIMNLFTLSRLDQVAQFCFSEKEALEHFKSKNVSTIVAR
ncbi:MAG: STAS domain-containing protein [SAR324 cluster bacterium]|nr:STAS domain-containing protein [SAR324 cluster bacterium]